jgi:hypothetical protein
MAKDQLSSPYYLEVFLVSQDILNLDAAVSDYPDKTVNPGLWALLNFEQWDPAFAAASKIDTFFDAKAIPHTVLLNSRSADYRRWS